jgi:hypothetical protein
MSTSIRISYETLKKLHDLRKHPSETIDSVIQRLIAKYLGEPDPPIILWGHIQKDKPIIRCKRLHAVKRKKRSVKILKLENPYRLRFY